MPGTYSQILLHAVFSTKSSAPFGAEILYFYGFYGFRSGEAPWLHPWLQPGAALGRY